MATTPPTATTAITAYHWYYKILINCTGTTPSNQLYKVTLKIDDIEILPPALFIASDSNPATTEAVICQWDVGTEIPSPSVFLVIVRAVP